MRPVLRLLGSRYGIALLLLVLVLGVVAISRAVSGTRPSATVDVGTPIGSGTTDPRAGDDGPVGTDGVVGGGPTGTANPTARDGGVTDGGAGPTNPTLAGPDPVPAATTFLNAWLAHRNVTASQWYAGIAPLITTTLAAKLKGTDPAGVPADRVTGSLSVTIRGSDAAQLAAPVDSGTVRLRMLLQKGRWLVDGIDWERG